ncbi:hypothetical protein [Streptomyces sp. 900105245]
MNVASRHGGLLTYVVVEAVEEGAGNLSPAPAPRRGAAGLEALDCYSTLSLDMELSRADDSPTFADTLATTDRSYGVILDREAAKYVPPGSSAAAAPASATRRRTPSRRRSPR